MDPTLKDILARLDSMSGQLAELRDGFRQAVAIADLDPDMALTRARKVLEFVVRDVFERHTGEKAGSRPLENLLQRLVKDGHLPKRVSAYANAVRELGNVGTHAYGEAITKADVAQSLAQLTVILEWYFEHERPAKEHAAPAEALGPGTPAGPVAPAAPTKPPRRRTFLFAVPIALTLGVLLASSALLLPPVRTWLYSPAAQGGGRPEAVRPADGASEPKREFVSLANNLQAILAHQRQTEPGARRYQRYFTFTNLYNNPAVAGSDLRLAEAALAGLLNGLGGKPAVVAPRPVDEKRTVFVVDIRRLGWERDDLWREVLKAYPYGLKHSQLPDDANSRRAAEDLYDLTGVKLPDVRADWFIARASRPPLVQTLLRRPAGDRDVRGVGDFPGVVGEVSRSYEDKEVGLDEAAYELGLEDGNTLKNLIEANSELDGLGLLPLAKGGSIKRDFWESDKGLTSTFQEAARIIKRGTPYVER